MNRGITSIEQCVNDSMVGDMCGEVQRTDTFDVLRIHLGIGIATSAHLFTYRRPVDPSTRRPVDPSTVGTGRYALHARRRTLDTCLYGTRHRHQYQCLHHISSTVLALCDKVHGCCLQHNHNHAKHETAMQQCSVRRATCSMHATCI